MMEYQLFVDRNVERSVPETQIEHKKAAVRFFNRHSVVSCVFGQLLVSGGLLVALVATVFAGAAPIFWLSQLF